MDTITNRNWYPNDDFPHTGGYFAAAGRRVGARHRRNEVMSHAGIRSATFSRWSGSLIGIYDAAVAGIDADYRWVCVCQDHNTIQDAATLADAKEFAATPEWCPGCYDAAAEASAYLDGLEAARGGPSRRGAYRDDIEAINRPLSDRRG